MRIIAATAWIIMSLVGLGVNLWLARSAVLDLRYVNEKGWGNGRLRLARSSLRSAWAKVGSQSLFLLASVLWLYRVIEYPIYWMILWPWVVIAGVALLAVDGWFHLHLIRSWQHEPPSKKVARDPAERTRSED